MDLDSKPDYFINDEPAPETGKPVIKFEGAGAPGPEKKSKKRHPLRRMMWWMAIVVILGLGATFWVRYINPYETDIEERGYIVDFKRQGIIFKTWEGQMVTQEALTDSTRPYSRQLTFSVDNDRTASRIAAAKGTGRPVTVTCKRYWGVLPWRGATPTIVTSVSQAD